MTASEVIHVLMSEFKISPTTSSTGGTTAPRRSNRPSLTLPPELESAGARAADGESDAHGVDSVNGEAADGDTPGSSTPMSADGSNGVLRGTFDSEVDGDVDGESASGGGTLRAAMNVIADLGSGPSTTTPQPPMPAGHSPFSMLGSAIDAASAHAALAGTMDEADSSPEIGRHGSSATIREKQRKRAMKRKVRLLAKAMKNQQAGQAHGHGRAGVSKKGRIRWGVSNKTGEVMYDQHRTGWGPGSGSLRGALRVTEKDFVRYFENKYGKKTPYADIPQVSQADPTLPSCSLVLCMYVM